MLTLAHIRKRFGDITAVDDFSLTINRGEVFGLLGPNGAGKTTSINILVGLLAADEGDVDIDEAGPPSAPAARARIGVAPQALALYDDLTALENVIFFGSMYGMEIAALRERANHAIELVGLTDRARDRVKTYSGGMKRRLNLAVALVHEPAILLLDEPTVGVDPQSRNAILETIKRLGSSGRTIIYTTHYMEEAQKLCNRVAIMDHGRILAIGTPDELIAKHGGQSVVRIERRDGEQRIQTADPLAEISRILSANGHDRPLALHIERPTLENVFLNLTGRTLRD